MKGRCPNWYGGLSDQEIARELGIHRNLVGQIAKSALQKVKERMSWPDEKLEIFLKTKKP